MTRLTLRIDFDDERQIGHGKIRLLEAVEREGSISAAARAMDMSYRRAWLLVDELNRMFTLPVTETQLGGKGGGNARLTDFGRELVAFYRELEARSSATFSAGIDRLKSRLAAHAGPSESEKLPPEA